MAESEPSAAAPLSLNAARESLQPDDVRAAAQRSYDLLVPLHEADWTHPAGDLEWDCRRTLEHLVLALDVYSLHLATPSPERGPLWPSPFPPDRYPGLSNGALLAILQRRAGVLAAVATGSAPTVRGFHSMGRPDPPGYIAMACVEIMVHTDDISRGLGSAYQPPEALCQRVVARLFPWAPSDLEPWTALRWLTGRLDLPGHGRTPANWAWHASPLAEWDGTIKTRDSYSGR